MHSEISASTHTCTCTIYNSDVIPQQSIICIIQIIIFICVDLAFVHVPLTMIYTYMYNVYVHVHTPCSFLPPSSHAVPIQCSANLVHPCVCKEQRWIISGDSGGTGHVCVLFPQKIVNEDPSDLFASQWWVHSGPLSCQGERMDTPLQSWETVRWALDRKRTYCNWLVLAVRVYTPVPPPSVSRHTPSHTH